MVGPWSLQNCSKGDIIWSFAKSKCKVDCVEFMKPCRGEWRKLHTFLTLTLDGGE